MNKLDKKLLANYNYSKLTNKQLIRNLIKYNYFYYKSYDFKKAIDYMDVGSEYMDNDLISDEVKELFVVWKKGKLRSINFNPLGSIRDVIVGYKWDKKFIASDFGKTIFFGKEKRDLDQ